MARILLVSTNVSREPFPVYPLGIAVLSSALESRGHVVRTFDFLVSGESEEAFRSEIRAFSPDIVAMSIRNVDSCDSFDRSPLSSSPSRLAAISRETTSAPIVIGGPAVSIFPDALLEETGANHCVIGEGERSLCRLVDDISAGRPTAKVLRDDSLLPIDEFPPLRLSEQDARYYLEEAGMVGVQTKRGCPHGCSYCSYPALEGRTFRKRPVDAVLEDVERAKVDHGVDTFFFTDSVFNDDEGHYLEVAEGILRKNLSIRWCCYMRPAGITRKEIHILKTAGLYAAELGTDATTDETLSALGKGFSFDDVLATNQAFDDEHIPCAHFAMFGGPGESDATIIRGLENVARLGRAVVFAYSGIRILPGTPLRDRAVREGTIDENVSLRTPIHYFSPGLDVAEMNHMILKAFRNRRDRIFPPVEGQKRLAIMRRFGFRGLLWDTLVRFPGDTSGALAGGTSPC